jgi:RNA polymerase sigma-70 factor, ECF subfamily
VDEVEFDEFYSASFQRVSVQLYAMIGNWDEAQECTQEAYARAWSHRKTLDSSRYPEAWVRTTAYRLAVSRWRRKGRERRDPDRALHQEQTVAAPGPAHVAVVEALKQIPEAQRRAVVLHHLCDMPVEEVAAEVGAPTGTVKARLSRGRAALRGLLGDFELNEGASHA